MKKRPKLTWKVVFQAFTCAFFGGSLAQNLGAESLVLTSATFAAAMTNLIPAVTFILGIFFGLERLELNTKAGIDKVIGTVLCIGGAMLLTFYKGFEVNIWSTHIDLMHKYRQPGGHVAEYHHNNILLPLCIYFINSSAKMSENYPCPYSSTALISTIGSVQAVGFALSTERDWSQWKLGWVIRLLTVAYMV
ncbi:hypothetical protein CASFOL_019839 [Castilleja foliolosa]|uniref:WAT1-related protein n=1 Tax=Castilleja foliolosa TaxID=1961234 RepID=A0ABD3CZZ8_9LAMI